MKALPIVVGGGLLAITIWGIRGPETAPRPALPLDPPGAGVGDGVSAFEPQFELEPAARVEAAAPVAEEHSAEEPEKREPLSSSPVALLDAEEWWHHYEPTFENMAKQIGAVPKYAELTEEQLRQAWETPGFQEAWTLNREHLALRTFIVGYQQREYDRWYAGQSSVALETELQPVGSFISAFPDPDLAWTAIDAYSTQVITAIYDVGESQPQQDDVEAKWALMQSFTEQANADTLIVEQILEEL